MWSVKSIITKDDKITKALLRRMPKMVGWFDPTVLLKIIRPVLISGIFGTYADRRLIQAALDTSDPKKLFDRCNIVQHLEFEEDGTLWIDYVADLGDGFDATYAVAYLLAQSHLVVDEQSLKKGSVLLLGGDQVYPDASRKSYEERFRIPYGWAYPDDVTPGVSHPLLFAIPGNHDWYDGLDLFLAYFCKEKPGSLGNWRSNQRRSYFAVKLTESWWLWGVDIQLSEYVDTPQAEYFQTIANEMPVGSNIILCTAVPGWLKIDYKEEKSNKCLGYFVSIARKAVGRNLHVPLVLSGDTHHYSRYVADSQKTQFITAGGGGAFLHPTHQLKSQIEGLWNDKRENIRLAGKGDAQLAGKGEEACYPSRMKSRLLTLYNVFFALLNWKFAGILGAIYAALGLLSLMWNDLSTFKNIIINPVVWVSAIIFWGIFYKYAVESEWIWRGRAVLVTNAKYRKLMLGTVHAAIHLVSFISLAGFLFRWIQADLGFQFWSWGFNIIFLGVAVGLGGFVAGTVFGIYLLLACLGLGTHSDHAFSALSLPSYKHFLRLKILGDTVTVYPVGLRTVPQRHQWKIDPINGTRSRVVPMEKMKINLIEPPILVTGRNSSFL